jgi:hypothetical protein
MATLYPEDGGRISLRNIIKYILICSASYRRVTRNIITKSVKHVDKFGMISEKPL